MSFKRLNSLDKPFESFVDIRSHLLKVGITNWMYAYMESSQPWNTLVEGDEQLDLLNRQTCMD